MSREADSGPRWSSQVLFLLAAMGCTIGLGNIWRFPFVAGENGGGAFLVIYVAALAAISVPVMLAELYLGRSGRKDPVHAIERLAREAGASPLWAWTGHLMAALGLLYLFYYPIIGSWALHYLWLSADGSLGNTTANSLPAVYDALQSNKTQMVLLHTLFLPAAAVITALGVRSGLESLAKYIMPLLLILLFGLIAYAAMTFGLGGGFKFLFTPDFSKITPQVVLAAVGQALFSTAVGQGVLMVYAGYLGGKVPLGRYSVVISAFDGFVAISAGVFVFSIVSVFALSPSAGEGLVYMALPLAFADMPGGSVISTAFFAMLALAAFTSVVPTIELLARWLERQIGMRHKTAALIVGAIAWIGGLSVVFTQGEGPSGLNLLRLYDYAVSNLMIPLAAFLMAVFVGWFLPRNMVSQHDGLPTGLLWQLWIWSLRIIAPSAIAIVFIANL